MMVFLLLISGVLTARLASVQLVQGERLSQLAQEQRLGSITIAPPRGSIKDRQGKELAFDVTVDSVAAHPPEVEDAAEASRLLAPLLDQSQEELTAHLSADVAFVWLHRQVDDESAEDIARLDLEGIRLVPETRRHYPEGMLCAHVVGFAGIDNQGLAGIEAAWEDELGGQIGEFRGETSGINEGIPLSPEELVTWEPGNDVYLTIDSSLQYVVEKELDSLMDRARPIAASIMVADTRTGEILALANRPAFDPNEPLEDTEQRENIAVEAHYEPGSTFKIVTVAAALEEDLVGLSSYFNCPGTIQAGDRQISCGGSHGTVSVAEVLAKSCNVGTVQIGRLLGAEAMYGYIDRLGFSESTHLNLPGEGSGVVHAVEDVGPLDLATNSFGHGLAVTPAQMLRLMVTLANGGETLQLQLVREIRDSEGEQIQGFTVKKGDRVFSPDTVQDVTAAMELVVTDGTGQDAAVDGYRLAGKTGTAQKVVDGRYSSRRHVASFVGFGPVEDPQLAAVVLLDEPQGEYYAGQVAAPVFAAIMEEGLRHRGIGPSSAAGIEAPVVDGEIAIKTPR